jgi:hypothetical protein
VLFQDAQRLEAAEPRHGVVGYNDLPGAVQQGRAHGLFAVDAHAIGRITGAAQLEQQQVRVVFVVLDQQKAQRQRHKAPAPARVQQ